MNPDRIRQTVAADFMLMTRAPSVAGAAADITRLLEASVLRVQINESLKAGEPLPWRPSENDLRHICDWLTSAVLRNEPWLERCDGKGRPLKLMKFGSMAQILAEADKAMRKRLNDGAGASATEGIKKVHDAGDGWSVVRLMTPEALDHEGFVMGHCVGLGAYDRAVASNFRGIYSLRDPQGKSHVTIEIDPVQERIEQIKGKQNAHPKPEYMRRLAGWQALAGLRVARGEMPPGFMLDREKGVVEFSRLAPGDTFTGDIEFDLADEADAVVLPIPAGITVRGTVSVRGGVPLLAEHGFSMVEVGLPPGVAIDGELIFHGVSIATDTIHASRLVVRNGEIARLGEVRCVISQFANASFRDDALAQARFHGSVEMQACRGVILHAGTAIRSRLSIGGCMPASGTALKPAVLFDDGFSLPHGTLYVRGSRCGFGGSEFSAGGNVELRDSTIDRMPQRLKVGKHLVVEDTLIDRMPELDVGGERTIRDVDTMEIRREPHGAARPGI